MAMVNLPDRMDRRIRTAAALIFGLACTVVLLWPPAQTEAARARIDPDSRHTHIAGIITHMIPQYHFRAKPLDDVLSSDILDAYIESLDPNRSNFFATDIDKFEVYRHRLDDELIHRELDAAYEIFDVYRQRVEERANYAISLLDEDFDFSVDEDYRFNREEAPWATDKQELDEIWRRRVKNDYLSLLLSDQEHDEIVSTLRKRYERMARRNDQVTGDDVFQFFMNAYTNAVEPHTAYFSPRISENFRIRMSLSLEGIGAVLQVENEFTRVRRVVPGGPADLSQALHADDRIIGVGQDDKGEIENVVGWRLDDVVDLIRGQKGTVVRLEILPKGVEPGGKAQIIRLVRDTIKLEEQAASSEIIETSSADRTWRLGVIDLPAFYSDFEGKQRGDPDYRSTTRDVARLLGELMASNVDGVVMDLRGNGGGSLTEATALTGLFIKSGPVVQILNSNGRVQINRDPDPGIVYTGPLAVLVDRNSASASEIFAGAIQDYRRGVIIGEPTFGKGTVQNLIDLGRSSKDSKSYGQLKVTVAQFFRINGESTQFRGVVPDITLPTATDGEYGERMLNHALPWATLQPAAYLAPVGNDYNRAINSALESYRTRMDSDAGLKYLHEIAEVDSETEKLVSITLNESKRRTLNENREKERLDLINTYRAAIGREPLDNMQRQTENDDEEDDNPDDSGDDVVLDESAEIFADFITVYQNWPASTIADRPYTSESPVTTN